MRVVELDCDLVCNKPPVVIRSAKTGHDVGERATDQKILLSKSQRLAGLRGVIGIKDAGDSLSDEPIGIAPTKSPELNSPKLK